MSELVIKGNTVQVTTKGYQLFYLPDDTKISNGVTTTIKDGLISCEGTVAVNGWFDVCRKLNISLKQGVEYTFGINKALSVRCALKTSENGLGIDRSIEIGKTSVQFTPKSDISSAYIWIYAPIGTNIDIQFMIQVEKGSTAHDYEPYTGGKPSPSPEYPQEVKGVDKIEGKIIGKNLFDINKINSNSNTTSTATINSVIDGVINAQWNTSYPSADIGSSNSSSGWVNIFNNSIELQPNTYTLSFKHKVIKKLTTIDNLRDFFIRVLNKTDNSIITNVNFTRDFANFKNISNTFTLSEVTSVYLLFSCNNCQIEIKDIQLEIGSTATPYQPYVEQSISYTLQNPLYKLSNTVYDYIDLDKGKIIRNVGIVEFDGSSDENWVIYGNNTNMNGYSINYKNISGDTPYVCDKLLTVGTISTVLEESVKPTTGWLYVVLNKIRGLNTTELFKTWLQTNPITVYYLLATPTEEDIPQELLTQLQSLKTYYPQTNIIWNTEVEPYINFDYKLNLPAWLEDKDNKDIIYDKKIETNQKALENQLTSEELDNQSIIDIDYRVTCLELDMEEQ